MSTHSGDWDSSITEWVPEVWNENQLHVIRKFIKSKNWGDQELERRLKDRVEELSSQMDLAGSDTLPPELVFVLDCAFVAAVPTDVNSRVVGDPMPLLNRVSCRLTIDELKALISYCISRQKLMSKADMKSITILRLFNDILNRMSHGTDAQMRGIVLMLLSHLTSTDDRSGVNVNGHYNEENITTYEEDISNCKDIIDYKLYKALWKIQDFFRNPTKLTTEAGWQSFCKCTDRILDIFQKCAKENVNSKKEALQGGPKYLTSTKLLKYQLVDPSFRRQFIIQIAIVCFTVAQLEQIGFGEKLSPPPTDGSSKKTSDKVSQFLTRAFDLIGSCPRVKSFAHRIFKREQDWIIWKHNKDGPNMRCPIIKRPPWSKRRKSPEKVQRRMDRYFEGGSCKMGCPELALLWRDSRAERRGIDYLRAPDRNFQSQWKEDVQGLVNDEQDEFLEPEERRRYDPKFSFTTLRLLRREDHRLFRKCLFETETQNFMWHLIRAIKPEVLVPKKEEGELWENPKVKVEEDKRIRVEPDKSPSRKLKSVPSSNENKTRRRRRESEEDEVFWFPAPKNISERKLKDVKVKKDSVKEKRKELRSSRTWDENEDGDSVEIDILPRESFERQKRDHERHSMKERSRKRSLNRTNDRWSDTKSRKIMIEDSTGIGKKQDRIAREEARRKRFAQGQETRSRRR